MSVSNRIYRYREHSSVYLEVDVVVGAVGSDGKRKEEEEKKKRSKRTLISRRAKKEVERMFV